MCICLISQNICHVNMMTLQIMFIIFNIHFAFTACIYNLFDFMYGERWPFNAQHLCVLSS